MEQIIRSATISVGIFYAIQRIAQMVLDSSRRVPLETANVMSDVSHQVNELHIDLSNRNQQTRGNPIVLNPNESVIVHINEGSVVVENPQELELEFDYVDADDGIGQPLFGDGDMPPYEAEIPATHTFMERSTKPKRRSHRTRWHRDFLLKEDKHWSPVRSRSRFRDESPLGRSPSGQSPSSRRSSNRRSSSRSPLRSRSPFRSRSPYRSSSPFRSRSPLRTRRSLSTSRTSVAIV